MDNPRFILLSAFWFGLLTGLCEAAILATRQFVFHQTIMLSEDVYWMAPVADMILFAVPGIFLGFAALLQPNLVPDQATIFIFVFLGYMSLLLMFPLSKKSTVVLSVGLAVVTSQILNARRDAFWRVMRRSSGWLAAAVIILFVSISLVYL